MKKLTLRTPGVEPGTNNSINSPPYPKIKRMKKIPYAPRDSNPEPNNLKRKPKRPDIGKGHYTRVYENVDRYLYKKSYLERIFT